jgi:flagellar hook protein FlgE
MSNYNVAFSGLDNVSHAIDTVSNNIANANTVGYKAGQWVFADQFMKAASSTDVARAGMGAQNLSVRRPMIQGTLTTSANPLDLAISGKGMFRLLSPSGISTDVGTSRVDPSALYYTRNGQFSVNKEGYIVNENGMYLTGYQTTVDGTLTDDIYGPGNKAGRIMMPEANLVGNKTTKSSLSAILDSTENAFTQSGGIQFDPRQSTFNHKTTQTIFDNEGNPHTLEVYYRRVEDGILTIKANADGYAYTPSQSALPNTGQATQVVLNAKSVLRVDTAPAINGLATSDTTNATALTINNLTVSGGIATVPQTGMRIFVNGVDTGAKVVAPTTASSITSSSAITVPKGAQVSFYPETAYTAAATANSASLTFTNASTIAPAAGMHIYLNGVDTGATVSSVTLPTGGVTTTTVTASTSVSVTNGDKVSFSMPLNMTMITPDGTEITVQGNSNQPGGGQSLTTTKAHVEVFASVDGRFFNRDDAPNNYASKSITSNTGNSLGYTAVAELMFIGGKNLDALVPDPQSGNPTFSTKTMLTTNFQNAAGGLSNLVFDLDLTNTSLQSSAFQMTQSVQNGQPMSKLTDVTVDSQGRIAGVYGNGKVRYAGQIALVHFDAFEQLAPVGKNAFSATVASGTEDSAEGVLVGHPGTGEFGEIKSQALESSNVDLSSELVRLMILQRTYSANSQSMKAVDQVMRDTLQMIS